MRRVNDGKDSLKNGNNTFELSNLLTFNREFEKGSCLRQNPLSITIELQTHTRLETRKMSHKLRCPAVNNVQDRVAVTGSDQALPCETSPTRTLPYPGWRP